MFRDGLDDAYDAATAGVEGSDGLTPLDGNCDGIADYPVDSHDSALVLNGSGIVLGFSENEGGVVKNFETVDLTRTGDNFAVIALGDLLRMTEDGNNVLRLEVDDGDTVELTGMADAVVTQ